METTSTTAASERRSGRGSGPSPLPQPTPADLVRAKELFDRGLIYDAFASLNHVAPLREWRDTEGLILAGRLAHHLGAARLADGLMLLAARRDPQSQRARYYGVRALLARRGPLEALDVMESHPVPEGDAIAKAEWLALRAHTKGLLRDFSSANADIDAALRTAPQHPWLALEHAALLEEQDRVDDALVEARRGLSLKPLHPGANMAVAHLLVLLGRDADAMALLDQAVSVIQSSSLVAMLAMMLTEHELFDEALGKWELCQRLMPLVDERMKLFTHSHLSHIHYLLGNIEESRRLAIETGDPMLLRVAERMAESREGQKRVHLRVPFIHQHYVTCAPTTLAMIGRFWRRTVEHLQIADEITYGGTAAHRERTWAEENGWATREFTLTWDAAVALLDRGLPFALTTVSGDRAHEQAVVGYDTHRDTLLTRDPSSPGLSEIDFEALLRTHRSNGPRAMVLVPRERASSLDGIHLADAAEHDLEHAMMLALDRNDREAAVARLAELEARAPESHVTFSARQTLAVYDHNLDALLASVDAQLALLPEDVSLLLTKTRCLGDLSRSAERKALLADLASRDDLHPLFLRLYADALSRDASESESALQFVRRYLRMVPVDAEGFRVLAGIEWVLGRPRRATRLYRFASCVADTHEGHASSYFLSASLSAESEAALLFLRQRFERFATQSSGPAQTLFWALAQVHRLDEAFEVVRQAVAGRPEDPDIHLFAADASARYGRFDDARSHLAKAQPIARRAEYLASVGNVQRYEGDLASALASWMEVHELDPLSPDAHASVAELLTAVRGRDEAVRFLESLVERFPTYQPAWGLLVSGLRDAEPARHEAAIRRLVEIAPQDAWTQRELALALAVQHRFDEALAACDRADEIERGSSTNATVRGRVLALAQRDEEAKQAFLRALEIYPDETYAVYGVADACRDGHERREVVEKLLLQAIDRTTNGEGLLALYPIAADAMEAEQVLALARKAVESRDALWQSHAMLLRQLLRMSKYDEAVEVAIASTKRFALQPAIWVDAAEAFGASSLESKQQEALEVALRIEPTNAEAAVGLARLLMRREQPGQAVAVLSEAAARIPLDATIQWILGSLLWDAGDREEALTRLCRAAKLSPRDEGIWRELQAHAAEYGNEELARATAAELTRERPSDPVSWIALSRNESEVEAQLAAADRAIAADPDFEGAYHRKIEVLVAEERFDEAMAVCESAAAGAPVSVGLRARAAWLRAVSGDLESAIAAMREIVAAEPAYSWGWFQLCQWHAAAGDLESYRSAARKLVQLEYSSPVAWNHLAEAELRSGNKREAEKGFNRALSLDPENAFAALWLVDLLIDSKRLARASEIAEQSERRTGVAEFKVKRIEIALRKKAIDDALKILRELLLQPGVETSVVERALERVRESAAVADFDALVEWAAGDPSANVAACGEWIRCCVSHSKWGDALQAISTLQGERAVAAASTYLELAGGSVNRRAFEKFMKLHRTWAFEENELWAMTTYCYNVFNDHHYALTWTEGWSARTGLSAWMLISPVIAARNMGKDEAAAAMGERALGLQEDGATAAHRVWLAADAAFAGDIEVAEGLVGPVDIESLDLLHRHVARIAWCLIVAARATAPGEWRYGAAQLDELIGASRQRMISPLARRLFKRAVSTIGKRYGRWTDALWLLNLKMKV